MVLCKLFWVIENIYFKILFVYYNVSIGTFRILFVIFGGNEGIITCSTTKSQILNVTNNTKTYKIEEKKIFSDSNV